MRKSGIPDRSSIDFARATLRLPIDFETIGLEGEMDDNATIATTKFEENRIDER